MDELTLPAQSSIPPTSPIPVLRSAWGVALGLTAGWVAVGSCGVLVASLQSLLVWLLLITAVILIRPQLELRSLAVAASIVALLLLVPRAIGSSPIQLPLAVAVSLGLMGTGAQGINRRLLLAAGIAVLALALFRFAQLQISPIWHLSDRLGGYLGAITSLATGRPLKIGATFAGLDFLIAMVVFWGGLLALTRPPRLASVLIAAACITVAHTVYLVILAHTPQITDLLPPTAIPLFDNPYIPPEFCWSTIASRLLPWNLPTVGALLHAMAAVLIIRWTPWHVREETVAVNSNVVSARRRIALVAAPTTLAILLPLVGSLNLEPSNLDGKRVVTNQQDDIDYLVAQHDAYGQQSAGTFGLLPLFIRSLGGEVQTLPQLTREDLQRADIVLLLHPDETFIDQQQQIFDYVRGGGSVVIVTDGFNPELSLESRTDDLLSATAISIAQDAATSETGNWQEAYLASAHGATSTATAPTARFLSDYGASLQLGWGAHPLVVGQWGWSAPQQGATWSESQPLRTGEQLGDLVLAAEQTIGQGRVVVLGGNTSLTNEGLVSSYTFVGNLLAYLAHDRAGPQVPWRQATSLMCCLAIMILLLRRPDATQLVCVCTVLALGFATTYALSRHAARVVPNGTLIADPDAGMASNRIAYIDQSHLEAYSFEDWGFDAINGLTLNLMRNGYLPLLQSQISAEQLDGAGLFISIAPSREFIAGERAILKSFVERGGVIICTVGAEQATASAALLAEFGLRVPPSPVPTDGSSPEPEPFGRTRPLYLNVAVADDDSYQVGMRMHAAWPVESTDGQADVIAYGHNQLRVVESDAELPVVLARPLGHGTIVLIGDTGFAMNKNLEYIGGEPFDGGYENAHFWRWLIARVTERPKWIPPRRVERAAAAATEEDQ